MEGVYKYLVENKDVLIKYNIISKEGWNNSGFQLWSNFHFFGSAVKKQLRGRFRKRKKSRQRKDNQEEDGV
jgi:hypothetical protein